MGSSTDKGLFKWIQTWPQFVIYTVVCCWMWSADLAWETIPRWYVSLCWEKILQNKPGSKSTSDRILMDVSDAMENIKGLIWNEVNQSPCLPWARPVELTLFTRRQKRSGLNHLTMAHTIFSLRNSICTISRNFQWSRNSEPATVCRYSNYTPPVIACCFGFSDHPAYLSFHPS